MAITVIRNADWAIAWQAAQNRHVYMRGVDVVFDGNTLSHVGRNYAGPADAIVDGSSRIEAMTLMTPDRVQTRSSCRRTTPSGKTAANTCTTCCERI